jgi:cell division protein FtsL
VRRQPAPRTPRRISGPARPTGGAAARAATVHAPARAPARARPSRARTRHAAKAPWRIRSAAYVRALPDHALLDRIIRGRAWIPLLGILLAGIVAMQVEVLKLNAGIGRSLERGSALQAQNELLRAGVTRLSDEQRIERIAAQMGMVMPAPEQMRFVTTGRASVSNAPNGIKAPDASAFEAALPTIGAPAAAQGTLTNTGLGTAPSTATSTAATGSTTAATGSTTAATGSTTAATGSTTAATGSTMAGSAGTTDGTGSAATATTPSAATTPATQVAGSPSTTDSQPSSSSSGGATPVGG